VLAPLIRNPRVTKWGSFRAGLRENLERGPEVNMKDVAELGLAVRWVQQALISAYEDNCPLTFRHIKKRRKSRRWTSELQFLRREVRWLFNKCWADNNPHSPKLYREAQRRYRKEI
jgi:hypothetical protein